MLSIHVDPTIMAGAVGPRLTIPTHVTPTGGDSTHPSILFFEDKWNGYRYWMLVTPYPNSDDQHEDPNLLVSNNGVDWAFAPGAPLPLDNQPGGAHYNSDVSLATAEGKLYAFWRTVDTTAAGTQETFWYRASEDGVTWTDKSMVFQGDINGGGKFLSPSFLWDGDNWVMYCVNMTTSPNTIERRKLAQDGTWSSAEVCTGITMQAGKEAWHMEVREFGGRYIMLVADIPTGTDVAVNADLILLTSEDGLKWESAAKPLIPRAQTGEHDRLYKSTFWPAVRNGVLGLDLWYGAILSSTNQWRLYKTWVGPRIPGTVREAQSGFYTYNGLVLGGSGVNGVSVGFSFPKPFSSVPNVQITIDNTVLHATVINRTTTGFTVRLENYTTTTAGVIGIQWLATVLN